MKINRTKLLDSLNIVNKAISSKSTVYILENILFDYKNGELKLSATDLEISISTRLHTQLSLTEEEFKTCIPSKLLTGLVSTMPDQEIDIEFENETIQVRGARSKNNIKCLSSDEFPVLPNSDDIKFKINSEMFKNLVNSVSFSASDEINRPVLNGILFECHHKNLMVAAANGFILAKDEISLDSEDFSVIIPSIPLGKITDIFDGDISVSFTDKAIILKSEETTVSIQLIEGKFPDASRFWKDMSIYTLTAEIKTKEFKQAIKQASLFIFDDSYNTMNFKIGLEEIELETNADQTGDSLVKVPCVSNKEGQVYLNSKSILDFLNVSGDEIQLLHAKEMSPVIFKQTDKKEYLFVIMPIHK